MDPTTITATAAVAAACLTGVGVAVRKSGILDAIVKVHHDWRHLAIVREQRRLAATTLPAGSVLTHTTVDGCRLTVRTSAAAIDQGTGDPR